MEVKTVSYTANDAAEQFATSLRDTGFAVLADHPITPDLVDEAYSAWQGFFASPEAEKGKWKFDPEKQDGFFPFRSENAKDAAAKDLKEFYHIYQWGRVPPSVKPISTKLYNALNDLGLELAKWLDGHMVKAGKAEGNPTRFYDMLDGSQGSLLRILHYPPVAEKIEAGAVRAAAHEDINLITLLMAGSEPGLEAQDNEGNWHRITCDKGMIAVNAGDMLALATDNYFPSTTHRVVNPESAATNTSRYSMPMFLQPKPDVPLTPGFTAGMFLQQRLKEIGLKK